MSLEVSQWTNTSRDYSACTQLKGATMKLTQRARGTNVVGPFPANNVNGLPVDQYNNTKCLLVTMVIFQVPSTATSTSYNLNNVIAQQRIKTATSASPCAPPPPPPARIPGIGITRPNSACRCARHRRRG